MNATERPDISVCIANYNGGDLVLTCLDSVFNQTGNFTLEVLVHDDASTDASIAGIRERHPDARILQSDNNAGFCVSNNRMADAARGRYLLLLNNDAVLRQDSLASLLACAEDGHQDCILGLPQNSMIDGTLVDRGYRTDPFLNPIPILQPGLHEVGIATGACLWIPRTIWTRAGGFPPWFESVAEDIYLCLAARLLGHRVLVLDGPGFDHWIGKNLGGGKIVDGGLHTTARRRALSERNKTFAMLCCYPWPALLALMPLHAMSLLGEAMFLALTGMPLATVLRIYGGVPYAAWQRRNQIRDLRAHLMRQRARNARLFAFTDWLPHKLRMLLRHGRPIVQ